MLSTLGFPHLPLDVLRLIFECCAEEDRQTAVALSRTSRLVYYWVRLVLYRNVDIKHRYQAESLIRTLQTSPEAEFLQWKIKSLSLDGSISIPDATTIIAACKSINALTCLIEPSQLPHDSISFANFRPFGYSFANVSPHLVHLSMTLDGFLCASDYGYMLPMFATITHLHLRQGSDYFQSWAWGDFSSLVSLTHIAFDIGIETPLHAVEEVLFQMPDTLRVCLVMLSPKDSSKKVEDCLEKDEQLRRMVKGEVDPRVVIGTRHGGAVPADIEKLVVRGGDEVTSGSSWDSGLWRLAEHVIPSRTSQNAA